MRCDGLIERLAVLHAVFNFNSPHPGKWHQALVMQILMSSLGMWSLLWLNRTHRQNKMSVLVPGCSGGVEQQKLSFGLAVINGG